MRWQGFVFIGLVAAALLIGCAQEEAAQIVTVIATRPHIEVTRVVTQIAEIPITVTPSPTRFPGTPTPKHLVVCLLTEPKSLYWYDNPAFGAAALAQQAVLHAIYENLYTTRSYDFQPQGLVKLPNLQDGDAVILPITVRAGDLVVNTQNQVVTLQEGIRLHTVDGTEVIFTGEPVTLAQMQVQFTFQPLVWSDGELVTAQDSVFSYKVARDPNTPGSKEKISRTASYMAINDHTVEWRGLPGWLDPLYFTNVWMPLPTHQWGGLAAATLLTAPQTTQTPLSHGPFVIDSWEHGTAIHLIRNEFYYRHEEGFPYIEQLTFRFVGNSDQLLALLLAGECHIATQDGLNLSQAMVLQDAQARQLLIPYFQNTLVFEHLDFNINPTNQYGSTRPDWFEAQAVRQAITQCIDRFALAEAISYGVGQVSDLFVPPDHPLIPNNLTEWEYNVAAANSMLDTLGYVDYNGDGIRQHPTSAKTFRVTLGIAQNNPTQAQLAQMIASDLADCGITVLIVQHTATEWFAPQGSLFGRRYDLALFPWITEMTPSCHFYTTSAIPTEINGWQGNNNLGWSDLAFDRACSELQRAFWGSEAFAAAAQATFHIFNEQIPSLPLFHYLKVSATSPTIQNFQPDTTQPSELWNLYELDIEE